jgi:hypothetical protein
VLICYKKQIILLFMNSKNNLVSVVFVLGLSFSATRASAVTLGGFSFENNSLAPTDTASSTLNFSNFAADSGIKNTSFVQGNGDIDSGPGSAYTGSGWSTSSSYSPNNNQNFFFTMTPNGTDYSVNDLTFDAKISGTGPQRLYVSTSADNYQSSISLTAGTNFTTLTAPFTNLDTLTNPLTIKISGAGASSAAGTLRVDNVQVEGDVGIVIPPVPPSLPSISIYQAADNVGKTIQTQGVVTANFLGSNGLGGFFVQDTNTSNNPAASGLSNGIFVSAPKLAPSSINIGQLINLVGQVSQSANNGIVKNQINLASDSIISSGNTVSPTTVTLPVASSNELQKYQGMLVTLPQTLSVTNNYGLGRYGEVGLSSEGTLYNPTQVATPGSAANAVAAANALNYIALDDNSIKQNPDPIAYPNPTPPGLTASNTLRVGDTTTGVTGILDSASKVSGPSKGAFVIDPTVLPTFDTTVNPRPVTPGNVGGQIKVGDANVLNYFTTLGDRGAQTEQEFQRQQAKVVSNILGLGADIVGLEEVQNNGFGSDSAIANLVNALNTASGTPGLYSYIIPKNVSQIGTDAITVDLIYKPSTVTPVGDTALLTTDIFSTNRPSEAQTFAPVTGGQDITVDVNHFKSKGGTPAAAGSCSSSDNSDKGQGGFNCTRTLQAQQLAAWLASNPTNSKYPLNLLILGDFNSYAKEDPITTLENSGFINLDQQFSNGTVPTSYAFGGQLGTLDYGFASTALDSLITGVSVWHINSPEPSVLDYTTAYKSANQINSLYSPDAYASSDHDPLVIGLNLGGVQAVPEPSSIAGSLLGFSLFVTVKIKSRKIKK